MSLVEFRNVYKRRKMGEVTINDVDGISFAIEEGEFAVIVGASGAGKPRRSIFWEVKSFLQVWVKVLIDM